jgi:hypothetical protein
MTNQLEDLTGKRFGHLVVLGPTERKLVGSKRKQLWRCKCVCGKEKEVVGQYLRRGRTRSCGCQSKPWKGLKRFDVDVYKNPDAGPWYERESE